MNEDDIDIKVKDLRPLSIEDLLNRDPVRMNLKEIGLSEVNQDALVLMVPGVRCLVLRQSRTYP